MNSVRPKVPVPALRTVDGERVVVLPLSLTMREIARIVVAAYTVAWGSQLKALSVLKISPGTCGARWREYLRANLATGQAEGSDAAS